jgi:hypothetical protein
VPPAGERGGSGGAGLCFLARTRDLRPQHRSAAREVDESLL